MNEIKRGRFSDFLVRLFGMDAGPPAPFCGGEVVPVQLVEQLGSELRWLGGWRRFSGHISQAGGAGGRSVVRLRNPVGSGAIVVVERVTLGQLTAANEVLNLGAGFVTSDLANLPAAGGYAGSDLRVGAGTGGGTTTARGAANLTSDVNPPTIIAANHLSQQYSTVTCVPLVYDREIILPAGTAIDCSTSLANITLTVQIAWRERAIDQLELNA